MIGGERWAEISRLLDEALDLPPAERRAHLTRRAAHDPELLAELEQLLTAGERDGALSRPVVDVAAPLLGAGDTSEHDAMGRLPGTIVGPYRIVSELGRGGMGTVYLAERADGEFEHQVALKLIKRGMDSEEVLRRFRAERQILARLRHEGIAHLHDGGVAADGTPWFAMERVAGEPLVAWAEARALPRDARLALFLQVCAAVQYAHRNLVVHRDIKPANVLVTADGRVKLLDFGIAKLLDDDPDGATRTVHRPMTPEYAAPEQLAGEPVTTSTDLFALGLLLHELLTGRRPERRGSATTSTTAATAPPTVERTLPRELRQILSRATAATPDRRYPSAESLAADIERYRSGKPVEAHADSLGYRLTKFVRRHRIAVAAGTTAVVALVAALVFALVAGAREARAARRAEAVRGFLVRLFEQANPEVNGGEAPTLRQVVEEGTRSVEPELGGEPEVAADLLGTLATLHNQLGDFDRGLELARRAHELASSSLGESATQAIAALTLVGEGLHHTEKDQEALIALDRAAELARRGPGDNSPELAEVLNRRGDVLRRLARYDEALATLTLAGEIYRRRQGALSPEYLSTRSGLGEILFQRSGEGDLIRAEELAREVLKARQAALPAGHPAIARALNDVALYLQSQGRFEESETLYREAVRIHDKANGADHPATLGARAERAAALSNLGRYDEALAELGVVAEGWKRRSGDASWGYCNAVNKIGFTLYQRGRAAEAVPHFAEVLGLFRRRLGPEHPDTLSAWSNFGGALAESGDFETAERELVQVLAIRRRISEELVVVPTLSMLGRTLRRKGDFAGALALHREAIAIDQRVLGPDHVDTALARYLAGLALLELRRYDDAGREISTALAVDRRGHPPGHSRIGEDLSALARVRTAERRVEEATALAREAVEIQTAAVGAASGKTSEARLVLAEALFADGQAAAARAEAALLVPLFESAGAAYSGPLARARHLLRS
jgi:eukaryotic-like serine/threonine-protein kinase